ncbi:MAG: hypothetical protein ACI38Q_05350 [Candidatus Bruticola sp.]
MTADDLLQAGSCMPCGMLTTLCSGLREPSWADSCVLSKVGEQRSKDVASVLSTQYGDIGKYAAKG